jgi:T5SS/PEP-CTERM-associated repeat protein/autotransporter-associated beta strand protein
MIKLFRPARRHRLAGLLATTSVVALGLALAMTTPSHADTWTGTSNDWFTAGNWSSGVPTIFDYAMIGTDTPNATVVGAPGAVAGNLLVGYFGTGTLTIQNGGALSNQYGFIGYDPNPGSTGTVTVSGAGSSWTNSGALAVGYGGTGTLTIQNGGAVSNSIGDIGYNPGSTGTVTVSGAGSSWTNSSDLSVGYGGTGTLTIQNGGAVSNGIGYIGNNPGSTGTVTVSGAGSSWTNSSDLYVGTGTLTIQNGGAVSNGIGYIGYNPGSTGTVTVSGAGSSWTNSGALAVGFSGTGALTIQHGGTVVSNTVGLIGGFGSGTVRVDGAGSSWTNSGALFVGLFGTGTLTVANGGTVSVSGTVTIASQAGSTGTLNIGAASGQAAVAPGTLNASSVAFGSGTGGIVFNHTASNYIFAPTISGAGSVTVEAGTTILTAANTYTGPTTINGGTLSVNGSILSGTTVNAGGTLAGTGTVGNVTVATGGTFAPGSTMAVSGSLAFQSGAIYLVQVGPSNASLANVNGTAMLTGGVVQTSFQPGSYISKSYDILHAAGGIGGSTFNGVSVGNPNLAASLSYTLTDVFLNLTASLGGGQTGLGSNQQTIANVINHVFNNGGALPPGFLTLFGLTGANLGNALTQASGETATGSQQTTFDAMNQFMGVMTDPFIDGRGDGFGASGGAPSGYASTQKTGAARDANAMFVKAPVVPFEQRWSTWTAGYGGSQTTDGNAAVGSNSSTSSIAGTAVGADYRFSPDTIAGFALAGGGTSFGVAGSGSGHSDLFQAGAFVRHNAGPAYITAALAYGWQDITTNRTVTIAGIDQLQARFNANAFSGRVEGGYRFVSPWIGGIGITPYAAAQFTTFDLPAYAEQALIGTNNFALAYGAKSVTDPRSELGFRTDKSFAMPDGVLTLRGRLAWAHDYDTDRSIGATFQTLPGASFVVNGAAQASDSVLTTASIERKWTNNWSIAATFEGEFSNVTNSYAGKGVVRYAW